jgi:hypothetical protein
MTSIEAAGRARKGSMRRGMFAAVPRNGGVAAKGCRRRARRSACLRAGGLPDNGVAGRGAGDPTQ